MPISSSQYRSSIGLYENRSVEKENGCRTAGLRPGRALRVNQILDFGKDIVKVSSSQNVMSVAPEIHPRVRPSIALPLLTLLSQMRISNVPIFPSYYDSGPQNVVAAEGHIQPGPPSAIQPVWDVVTNALDEVDGFMARNDPLKFPGAHAASDGGTKTAPRDEPDGYAKDPDTVAQTRTQPQEGSPSLWSTDSYSDDDILLCNVLRYPRIDSVSLEIAFRLLAKAQTRSITYMARTAQNMYFESHFGRCPSPAEASYITSVTAPLDDLVFDSLSLARGGYVVQYGKLLLKYICEKIAESQGRDFKDLVRVPDAPVVLDESIKNRFGPDSVAGPNGTAQW